MPSLSLQSEFSPVNERMERVLSVMFRGIHHCPEIHKYHVDTKHERWEVNTWNDLSTYDFDLLTRLVIAGHDECVRVTITNSGPRMVKIQLWPRFKREGSVTERHPTIDQAIASLRSSKR